MTIELIEGTLDTESVSRIVSEVLRWMTFDPDAIEHMRATTPTWRDWIGLLDGEPVGVGGCGIETGWKKSSAIFASLCVLPAARHRGVGGDAVGPSLPVRPRARPGTVGICSPSPTIRTATVSPDNTDSPL